MPDMYFFLGKFQARIDKGISGLMLSLMDIDTSAITKLRAKQNMLRKKM